MNTKRLKAVVRVEIDIEADSVWSSDASFEQVEKQAIIDIRGVLTQPEFTNGKIRSMKVVEVRVRPEVSS